MLILGLCYRTLKNSNSDVLQYGHVYYYVKCLKCGATFYKPFFLRQTGCPVCSNIKVVQGINDIPTTNPEMIKYFQGGVEEAKLYHSGSTQKIYPKCPECGRIHNKLVSITNLKLYGFQCICSDGISYPEKFVINLLDQCNINYVF